MTLEELRRKLAELLTSPYDPEAVHARAERLLLDYINDPEIERLWESADWWYA